jgi:hypothetical protein
MTRFFVSTSYEETVEKVCKLLDRLSYTWKIAAKVVCIHYFAEYVFLCCASKKGMHVLYTVLPCILLALCFWVILKDLSHMATAPPPRHTHKREASGSCNHLAQKKKSKALFSYFAVCCVFFIVLALLSSCSF